MAKNEKELLHAARSGSAEAVEELLALHEMQIYRFGLRICGSEEDARDVLQQTLLAAFEGLHQFRGEGRLSTWLYQLARTACMRSRRRRVGEPAFHESLNHVEAMQSIEDRADPEVRTQARQMGEILEAALLALPLPQREVLVLRDVEGLSGEEAAQVLGIDLAALKSRLHRGRMQLRENLTTLLGDPPDAGLEVCEGLRGSLLVESLEIDQAACERIEEHLLDCETCAPLCEDLKRKVSLCKRIPGDEVPAPVRASVRQALHVMGWGLGGISPS